MTPQMSLLSLYVWLSRQSHLFPICAVFTWNNTRSDLHIFCRIPRNCQCKWLLVSSSAPGTSKFLFYTGMTVSTVLPNLVPPWHIDECFAIHFLHWEFCDPLQSSRQNVPLWARLHQYVFCKKPLLFSSSSRFHNLGPSESAYIHCAYPNLVPLLLAAPSEDHELTWKCLDFLALGFTKALLKHDHRPNSLWIRVASPAIHVIYRSVLLRTPHFNFCFRFLWILAAGFPEALHSCFHFFRVLDFRCICWHQVRNPVMNRRRTSWCPHGLQLSRFKSLSYWPYANSPLNQLQTFFPPALLLTQPGLVQVPLR